MRVLIDGCIFNQSHQSEGFHLWTNIIPIIVEELSEFKIYFLNRTSDTIFPEVKYLYNLFAPSPDVDDFLAEDRRLAALCKELEIDIFISTAYTSAGTQVKSLLVLSPFENFSSCLKDSRREQCWKIATGCFYWSQHISINDEDKLLLVSPIIPSKLADISHSNWKVIGQSLVVMIRKLFEYKLSSEQIKSRFVMEEELTRKRLEIKKSLEEKALKEWELYQAKISNPSFKDKVTYKIKRLYFFLQNPSEFYKFINIKFITKSESNL